MDFFKSFMAREYFFSFKQNTRVLKTILSFLLFVQISAFGTVDSCSTKVWVVTDKKIILFADSPTKILMPVNGAKTPGIQWSWNPIKGLSDPFSLNPYFELTQSFINELGGTTFSTPYFISGILPGSTCKNFAIIDVVILARLKPYEAISPNNDELNDYWSIDNISAYPDAEIYVMDRWGLKVYESSGAMYDEKPFRGKYNGKDLPTGTYMYVIRPNYENYPDAYPDVVGNLTIVR